MIRIKVRTETFRLLQKIESFSIDEVESEEGDYISFPITEETAARLREISPDPEAALLILVAKGGAS